MAETNELQVMIQQRIECLKLALGSPEALS